ncbi:MAG TPA: hypothetical protein VGY57_04760 [Vicinamibacterales bacterium]|nr:hypothetical protein [Vicinamibacterales bacterium]
MTDKIYRQAFVQAKNDLALAVGRRALAEKEAAEAAAAAVQLRRTVTALAVMCGENVEDSMGLTEAIRTIIEGMSTKNWYTLKYFKTQIEQLGVSLDDLKNADASVLSVLGRLVAGKELQTKMVKIGNPQTETRAWAKTVAVQPSDHNEPLTDDDVPF